MHVWKECGETHINLTRDDLVTPEARDVAKELGIALVENTRAHSGARAPSDSRPSSARGATVQVIRADRVQFEPFPFDVKRADMQIRAADVITAREGSPLGAGFLAFERGSFPWTLEYDEIEYVIEGELEIRVGETSYFGKPGDVLYIPRGTRLLFGTPSFVKFLYVTYPANWAEQ
jgi:ethanolamine utilization protein EutQ